MGRWLPHCESSDVLRCCLGFVNCGKWSSGLTNVLLNYPRPNLMFNTQSLKGCQMYYEANNYLSSGLNSEDVGQIVESKRAQSPHLCENLQ